MNNDTNRKISTLMMKINPSPNKGAGQAQREQQYRNNNLNVNSQIFEDGSSKENNDAGYVGRSNTAIWRTNNNE